MQINWEDGEREKFVKRAHEAMCRLDQARESAQHGADGHALAMYFRVDTEIAARLYKMLPADLRADIEAGDEPPGK